MRQARVHIFAAFCNETRARIKAKRMSLRAEFDFQEAALPRSTQQFMKNRRANAVTTRTTQHRHAADFAFGQ